MNEKLKNQTDQSDLLYSMMFWYTYVACLIGQLGFDFRSDGTSNLKSTEEA